MQVFLFINGILTRPGESKNWTARAVTWTHINTPHKAEKIEYFTTVLQRPLNNAARAEKLATTLDYYLKAGFEVTIAAHSNGADVALDALKSRAWPKIKALHLISAANEADFNKNGLNQSLDRIADLNVWIAENDWALALANTLPGKLLGYGTLGRRGPINARRPVNVRRAAFGHGDWFAADQLDHTLQFITRSA
ncbi:hypothetical protein [Prosthecobacter sp.]|uniref:hypothetical protein n=1 Tax=Prosthecobacter sp. TaxID=1965333 RepID=UPI0037C5212A